MERDIERAGQVSVAFEVVPVEKPRHELQMAA
jgi:hypothetical protein